MQRLIHLNRLWRFFVPFVCVCVLWFFFFGNRLHGFDGNLLVDAVFFLSFTRATLRCFWIWICLYWGLPLADMPLTLNRFPTPVSFFFFVYILVALPRRYAAYAQTGLQSLFFFLIPFLKTYVRYFLQTFMCTFLCLAHMPRTLKEVCQVYLAASSKACAGLLLALQCQVCFAASICAAAAVAPAAAVALLLLASPPGLLAIKAHPQ